MVKCAAQRVNLGSHPCCGTHRTPGTRGCCRVKYFVVAPERCEPVSQLAADRSRDASPCCAATQWKLSSRHRPTLMCVMEIHPLVCRCCSLPAERLLRVLCKTFCSPPNRQVLNIQASPNISPEASQSPLHLATWRALLAAAARTHHRAATRARTAGAAAVLHRARPTACRAGRSPAGRHLLSVSGEAHTYSLLPRARSHGTVPCRWLQTVMQCYSKGALC